MNTIYKIIITFNNLKKKQKKLVAIVCNAALLPNFEPLPQKIWVISIILIIENLLYLEFHLIKVRINQYKKIVKKIK